jgi:ElaB/YqjD/DUF883 family membrane-anchored ribosome-binding protein
VATQWRKRGAEDPPRQLRSIAADLRDLTQSVSELADDVGNYHRAAEKSAWNRHEAVLASFRDRSHSLENVIRDHPGRQQSA